MSSKDVLVGVVAGVATGVAAGALLGILFAPKKGSETREKIHTLGREYANVVKEKFNEFLDVLIEKFESGKSEVSELTKKVETKIEDEFDDVSKQY